MEYNTALQLIEEILEKQKENSEILNRIESRVTSIEESLLGNAKKLEIKTEQNKQYESDNIRDSFSESGDKVEKSMDTLMDKINHVYALLEKYQEMTDRQDKQN